MQVRSVELRHGRWEVRIQLPDYDIDEPSKDISVGTWQAPDGHGLLISTTDWRDLQSIAFFLGAAARDCEKVDIDA